MADGRVKVDVVVRSLSELNRIKKQLGDNLGQVKLLDTGIGSLGNRLGFVAFQFTFLAGVAGRALGEIQQHLQRTIEDASAAQDQVIRAIAQSGIDISANRNAEAVQHLNNAIRDLGSGKTLFNTKEVAEAAKEVGRAFTFSGNEMEKVRSIAAVTQGVLRLMTIEQIDAEKASIQLAKIMKQFNLTAQETGRLVGVLTVVNQSSSATLDQLTASMSAAGNISREFGVSLEELAVASGVLADRIGVKNSAAGRAFRRILENLARTTQSLNPQLKAFGINIRNSDGQLNNIVDILREFKTAMDKGGKAGSIVRQVIQELGSTSILSKDALLALVQGFDDLEEGLERLKDAEDIGAQLEMIFTNTAEARIKRLKNAIQSLQIDFVAGLSPALEIIITELNAIVRDTGVQELFVALGKEIGQTLVPIVRQLGLLFRGLSNSLKDNNVIIQILTKGAIALVGVLTTLFIVGTIGALVAALAAGMQRLAGFLNISAASAMLFTRAMLPLLAAGIGVFIALKALDNIVGLFKDGLQASELPALALNTALLLLGGTITALGLSFTTFGSGITKIPGLLRGLVDSIRAIGLGQTIGLIGSGIGSSFKDNILKGAGGLAGKAKGLIQGLGKAGIVGAAIAAAAVIGIAIADEINRRVENSPFFKTGLADKFEVGAFELKAAVASTIRVIIGFFASLPEAFSKILTQIIDNAHRALGKLMEAFEAASRFDFVKAGELLGQALSEAFNFGDINILDEIRGVFDAEFLAREEIKKRLERLKAAGFGATSQEVLQNIGDVLQKTQTGDVLGNQITDLIQEVFGPDAFTQLSDSVATSAEAVSELTEETTAITEIVNDTVSNYENLKKEVVTQEKTIKKATLTLKESTDKVSTNIAEVVRNTDSTVKNSNVKDLMTAAINDVIFELVRSQNRLVDFILSVDRANIAFTKMAVEGTEAARRLATLRVSKEGEFSISGRRTGTSFADITGLEGLVVSLRDMLTEDMTNLVKTDVLGVKDLLSTTTFTPIQPLGGQNGSTTTNNNNIVINLEGLEGATSEEVVDLLLEQINNNIEGTNKIVT